MRTVPGCRGARQFRGDAPTDTVASGSFVGAYLSDGGHKAAACHFHPGVLVYFAEHVVGRFHVQVVGSVPFREDERGFGLSLFVDECHAFVAQDFKGDLGREQVFRQGGLYGSAGQDLLWQVDGHARQVEDFDLCAAHDVVHGQGDGLQSGVLHLMVFPSITPPSVSICGLPKMVVSNGMASLRVLCPGRLRSDTACAVYS